MPNRDENKKERRRKEHLEQKKKKNILVNPSLKRTITSKPTQHLHIKERRDDTKEELACYRLMYDEYSCNCSTSQRIKNKTDLEKDGKARVYIGLQMDGTFCLPPYIYFTRATQWQHYYGPPDAGTVIHSNQLPKVDLLRHAFKKCYYYIPKSQKLTHTQHTNVLIAFVYK